MDNERKLFEELLKSDGIDPAGPTEAERAGFANMLDERSKRKGQKQGIAWPEIWRKIMANKMVRVAAAAVIIIAAIFGLNIVGGPDAASVAYGMTDLPDILGRAQTIEITGWRYLSDDAIASDKKDKRVDSSCYIDTRHERVRWRQLGGDTTIDGQYMTKINHNVRSVNFYKVSDFQKKKWLRYMYDHNLDRAFMSEVELSEFERTGHETIEGFEYDIWERTTTWPYPSDREIKQIVWLSPMTGEVRRMRRLVRGEFTNGKWCIAGDKEVRLNREFEASTFAPEIPETYRMAHTKENAPQYCSLIWSFYVNDKRSEIRYVFTLPDGSVIMVWSVGVSPLDGSSVALYQALEPGRSMPTKPVEILYGLTPPGEARYDGTGYDVTFDDTSISYSGRFLAWTVKDDQLYEWVIYAPDKEVDVGEVLDKCEIVIGMNHENPTWRHVKRARLYDNTIVLRDDEFDTFVLGAIAELSDDEVIPQYMTYDNIQNMVEGMRTTVKE